MSKAIKLRQFDIEVLREVQNTPCHSYALARHLQCPYSAAHYTLSKLEDAGMVKKRTVKQPNAPRAHRYSITKKGERALIAHGYLHVKTGQERAQQLLCEYRNECKKLASLYSLGFGA